MKIRLNGLRVAVLLVLLVNGFVLVQFARNRAAAPVAEFELTDRELRMVGYGEDNSGVILWLTFQNDRHVYSSELSRKTYLALEYDGPAFREWQDRQPVRHGQPAPSLDQISRLVLLDVGPDATALRKRYPDARKVIILSGAARGNERSFARLQVNTIHVPLPHSGALKGATHYRVRLRQGPSLEIWIAEVQRIIG